MAVNEALEKKVKELEDRTRCDVVDAGAEVELANLKDEVRRLRAENSALHSNSHCMLLFNCL